LLTQFNLIGALQTAINATTLALVDAGIPMEDVLCACSVGFASEKPILGKFKKRFSLLKHAANPASCRC
jgi:ribonuclease PH